MKHFNKIFSCFAKKGGVVNLLIILMASIASLPLTSCTSTNALAGKESKGEAVANGEHLYKKMLEHPVRYKNYKEFVFWGMMKEEWNGWRKNFVLRWGKNECDKLVDQLSSRYGPMPLWGVQSAY